MKIILLIIPSINYRKIITEKEFLNGNEFRTQNEIIEVLKLLGFKPEKDFTCDLTILEK